ncbi:MAG TPA: 3-hydroxyacyl-CoA dehydrogenase NAD-binding domain-containing protein, partial [Gemmatimonadaceae bacterium]|nr:3-hydroxyacyl-CoA dehydrogenase NAD-binding domain-containing protein [Gemmatimonadaceae bacterium]
MKEIRKVGVLGGGLMGSGIAQVSAMAGFNTVVREVSEPLIEKSRSGIEKVLAKGIERAKVTPEQRDSAMNKLSFTTDLGRLAECEIIVEAVVEDLEMKNAM